MRCRHLVTFLVVGTLASGALADTTPLVISCYGGPKTSATVVASLCDALAEELDQRKPDSVVRQGTEQDTPPKKFWDVVLEVSRTEDYHWEAHLSWGKVRRGKDGKRTNGPDVEIFGMDAPLGQGAYSHFVRSLLKVSKPAFLESPKDVNIAF